MVKQQNSSPPQPRFASYMALSDAKSRITETRHYVRLLQIGSLAMHHVNKFPYPCLSLFQPVLFSEDERWSENLWLTMQKCKMTQTLTLSTYCCYLPINKPMVIARKFKYCYF